MTEQSEFSLIAQIPAVGAPTDALIIGPGDDAAVLQLAAGEQWVLTTDTLLEGVHFPPGLPPALLGRRALAVNLSDLAAMGAQPGAFLVALTHPQLDNNWMQAFASGLQQAAGSTGAVLAGGNLCRGPLSVTITATGMVPCGQALLRSGAQEGDLIYVSGTLGAAALALAELQQHPHLLAQFADPDHTLPPDLAPYLAPQPQLQLGQALRGIATACIDISDGLVADLGHLCQASKLGAHVSLAQVPVVGDPQRAVTAGDDYQLLFTVAPQQVRHLPEQPAPLTHIGMMVAGSGPEVFDGHGKRLSFAAPGWEHFP